MIPVTTKDGSQKRGKKGLIWSHEGEEFEGNGREIPKRPPEAKPKKKGKR